MNRRLELETQKAVAVAQYRAAKAAGKGSLVDALDGHITAINQELDSLNTSSSAEEDNCSEMMAEYVL